MSINEIGIQKKSPPDSNATVRPIKHLTFIPAERGQRGVWLTPNLQATPGETIVRAVPVNK